MMGEGSVRYAQLSKGLCPAKPLSPPPQAVGIPHLKPLRSDYGQKPEAGGAGALSLPMPTPATGGCSQVGSHLKMHHREPQLEGLG